MKQRAKRWAFLSISTTFWITWHRAWPNSLPLIPFYFFPFLIFHVGLFWLNINVWYVLQWNEGALQFVTYYYKSVLWIRNKRLQYANERLDAKLLFPKRSCGNLSVHWFFFHICRPASTRGRVYLTVGPFRRCSVYHVFVQTTKTGCSQTQLASRASFTVNWWKIVAKALTPCRIHSFIHSFIPTKYT